MLTVFELYEKLLSIYGHQNWWPSNSPFETMIGAILTQNTNWNNVVKAIEGLADNCNPESILRLTNEELASLIRPSGYHNQKAKKIKNLSTWFKSYGYSIEKVKEKQLEELRVELLNINGVGPETADDILVYALEKPSFIIDTYTRRLFSRIGFEVPKTYEQFQGLIEEGIPKETKIYNEFHALIVIHAKESCRKKPICIGCPLASQCKMMYEH